MKRGILIITAILILFSILSSEGRKYLLQQGGCNPGQGDIITACNCVISNADSISKNCMEIAKNNPAAGELLRELCDQTGGGVGSLVFGTCKFITGGSSDGVVAMFLKFLKTFNLETTFVQIVNFFVDLANGVEGVQIPNIDLTELERWKEGIGKLFDQIGNAQRGCPSNYLLPNCVLQDSTDSSCAYRLLTNPDTNQQEWIPMGIGDVCQKTQLNCAKLDPSLYKENCVADKYSKCTVRWNAYKQGIHVLVCYSEAKSYDGAGDPVLDPDGWPIPNNPCAVCLKDNVDITTCKTEYITGNGCTKLSDITIVGVKEVYDSSMQKIDPNGAIGCVDKNKILEKSKIITNKGVFTPGSSGLCLGGCTINPDKSLDSCAKPCYISGNDICCPDIVQGKPMNTFAWQGPSRGTSIPAECKSYCNIDNSLVCTETCELVAKETCSIVPSPTPTPQPTVPPSQPGGGGWF